MTVFALGRRTDFSAELVGDELQPVANAEHRLVVMEDAVVNLGSIGVVNGTRSAAEHDPGRVVALDLVPGSVARQHDGEDVELADAARDELRVLGAKIKDNDGLPGSATFGGGRLCEGFHVLF